ncbi:MAG: VCBS repeat-containing protein [Alphaproteobacteria bacterium]|nr:VCBS repeat-containing protein [Alphaproteobacteria bacterium]
MKLGLLTVFFLMCFQGFSQALFTKIPSDSSNLKFINTIPEDPNLNIITYEYYYNGGGVAAADFNNDGLIDLYFTANWLPNRLFINKGNFKFEDITIASGTGGRPGWKTGVSVADVNGDGWTDIYVCYSGDLDSNLRANQLYINNGNLTFTDQAAHYGINDKGFSTQAVFFDFDQDNDLDLFVLNHNIKDFRNFDAAYMKKIYDPYAGDQFYENLGTHFVNITQQAGIIANPLGYGLGIVACDINNDGWQDIYVSNDYVEQDYYYINNHNKTFTECLKSQFGHVSNFSMGLDIADLNNDGWNDILTLDMLPESNHRQKLLYNPDNYELYQNMLDNGFYHQLMRNMLHLNNKNGSFSEIGQFANLEHTDWSWSVLMADVNQDGFKDVFISNGYGRDVTNKDFVKFYANERLKYLNGTLNEKYFQILQTIQPVKLTNYIYQQNDNLKFKNKASEWGLSDSTISNGAAFADLDNDGDLDLIVNNLNQETFLYKNNASKHNQYSRVLKIILKSHSKNSDALGSKVTVFANNQQYTLDHIAVRGFQSSTITPLLFYIPNQSCDSIHIQWANGNMSKLYHHVMLPQSLTIYDTMYLVTRSPQPLNDKLYLSQSNTLPALPKHQNSSTNDFKIQPLIHTMFSKSNPNIISTDLNNDGISEFYICLGEHQTKHIYTIDNQQNIVPYKGFKEKNPDFNDVNAVFFDADNDGDLDLYIVCGVYANPNQFNQQDRFYENSNGTFVYKPKAIPIENLSGSKAIAYDFDQDGDEDLFVGSKLSPENYPVIPESLLLLNNGKGQFKKADPNTFTEFRYIGMIEDLALEDLNQDGIKELIVAGQWMPLKIYSFSNKIWQDVTNQYFSTSISGWWSKIALVDIDNDHNLDIIATNWGTNSLFKPTFKEPIRIYYADINKDSFMDPIYTQYFQGQEFPMASKDELTDQLSFLRQKFPNYTAYADAQIQNIFTTAQLNEFKILETNFLETTLFENSHGKFLPKSLPPQVNYAPITAVEIADLNNDGFQDIIMGGNIDNNRIRIGKIDALYGLILINDTKGNFVVSPANESGFFLKGNIKTLKKLYNKKQEFILVGINDDFFNLFTILNTHDK